MRANFVDGPGDWGKVPYGGDLPDAACLFREDYFDPVTRGRRRRFYDFAEIRSRPEASWVHKHPELPEEVGDCNHAGLFAQAVADLHADAWGCTAARLSPGSGRRPGREAGGDSLWTLASVERSGDDAGVVSLRARLNFGYLPALRPDALPAAARERVTAAVGRVVDAAHPRSGLALVDLCRPSTLREKDLGEVVSALPVQSCIARGAADIIPLLHRRGKSTSRCGLESGVCQTDGAFALEAFGFLLRDIGWAR